MGALDRGLPTGRAERRDEVRIPVDANQPGCERVRVLDVDEDAVHAVPDEIRRLSGACRHERDAGRHRLEHALGPALLA